MKIRIAKESDVNSIANLHYEVRAFYNIGFFSKMNKQFIRQYYKLILKEKNQVVLCSEDDKGEIVGFVCATMDASEHYDHLRKCKLSLAMACLGSLVQRPFLVIELWKRFQATKVKSNKEYVVKTGARGEYWAWDKKNNDSIASLELYETHLKLLQLLGVDKFYIEVDEDNKKIFLFHKQNGAILERSMLLPDGRKRYILYYELLNKTFKF